MNGQPEPAGLVFPSREAGIYPLLGFILLSACVHAFGFYVFQTIYPPAAHIGPPPVQVSLLMPGTPEADAILRWVNSEDPAIAAEPAKAAVPDLMNLPYIPSYRIVRARPAMAPTSEPPLPYPAGVSGLDLVKMAAARPAAAAPPPASTATALIFSGPLKDAALDPLPSLSALREEDTGELRPARYLLGVSGDGEVRYVFLQDSSGDKTLDDSASQVLELVRFRESNTGMTWGFATLYWGSSVYAPPKEGVQ
jgi:hypothetical protein